MNTWQKWLNNSGTSEGVRKSWESRKRAAPKSNDPNKVPGIIPGIDLYYGDVYREKLNPESAVQIVKDKVPDDPYADFDYDGPTGDQGYGSLKDLKTGELIPMFPLFAHGVKAGGWVKDRLNPDRTYPASWHRH